MKCFNKTWEKERIKVELRLNKILDKEIKSIRSSTQHEETVDPDYALELKKSMSALITRRSLTVYESENIVLQRMQIRTSFIAVVISSIALIISLLVFFVK